MTSRDATIKLAKKRLDLSDSQFRQRAIEIISQVQRAYWDLVFARRDHEIKNEALANGQIQLEHNQRLVEAGTLAPADVISTRVDVERRKDEFEAAIEVIQRAENGLKALMLQPTSTELWDSVIEPTDRPEISTDGSDVAERCDVLHAFQIAAGIGAISLARRSQ